MAESILKSRLKKVASGGWKSVDSFLLKSGDMISFNVSYISNRPWFQISHESDFNISSYYDGSDYNRAIEYYVELLIAFKGVKAAETFRKKSGTFKTLIDQFVTRETIPQGLKSQPLFLGINNF